MYFCIRDDDTSFFTSPDELESGLRRNHEAWSRCRWPSFLSVKQEQAKACLKSIAGSGLSIRCIRTVRSSNGCAIGSPQARIEPMLHGYHHDEEDRLFEFVDGDRLAERVRDGKKYLEDLLGSAIRIFVAPRNGIGREGLKAIANEGLHLAGVAGHTYRMASIVSADLGHLVAYPQMEVERRTRDSLGSQPWGSREIAGNAVTPISNLQENEARYDSARRLGGVFCAATHYWELGVPCLPPNAGTVGEQLQCLVDRAKSDPQVVWRSVGDIISGTI